ncbi:MAG TPA: AmmeMemoRadiSam system protein B [Candidatus Omnitrophota bacterium]|nr:AmmeMemoRadiSam system protein B [Candidatus Omnitrophota bacterium]
MKAPIFGFMRVVCAAAMFVSCAMRVDAQPSMKQPNVAGAFYPADEQELAALIDGMLDKAASTGPARINADIFGLISPHAGYQYSGQTAAYGYHQIKGRGYTTIVILGPSHSVRFNGVSIYPRGAFRTPLGDIEIDWPFAGQLLALEPSASAELMVFEREHSIEVQLPFLQKVLKDFRIVPVMMGDCDLALCRRLAAALKAAIGTRTDVLVIASTDMYHGYDYDECSRIDNMTLTSVKDMDAGGLYKGLREGTAQLCGGTAVVTLLELAKSMGHDKALILAQTNSALVTNTMKKGVWTVGYSSVVIDQEKGEDAMLLNTEQQKKMLDLARRSIETYLKTGKKLQVTETDPVLAGEMGAFVTLHEKGRLRGCIGNIVGRQSLYLTIRDMAVEAATGDPRFSPVKIGDLKGIEIEISVLSSLERVDSADKIEMGKHGVLVRRGFNTGVFLPQVATETGWSKEEFLSELCSQKAGLSPDAWKDKNTELYIFTAEVFK